MHLASIKPLRCVTQFGPWACDDHRRRAPAQGRGRSAIATPLLLGGLCLAFGLPSQARAESGNFNLHLDLGMALPVTGELGPPEGGGKIPIGGVGTLGLDWQLASPFAIELLVGGGYFFGATAEMGTEDRPYVHTGLGGRYRFMDNREGYADEPPFGDFLGNFWVGAHVGYHRFDGDQFGVDLGAGYEWSVMSPIQLGLFGRAAVLFGGDGARVDTIVSAGLSGSIEFGGRPPVLDSDDDGLSDEREMGRFGTDAMNPDTDGDGLGDGLEVTTSTDPLNPDTDGDALLDGVEDANKNGAVDGEETDPRQADSDHGGVPDGWEVQHPPMNPRDPVDDDKDHDGVPEHLDRCPETPPNVEVDQNGCTILRAQMVFSGIQFEFDSTAILPTSEATLRHALSLLNDNADVRVEIEGHTDNVGAAAYNQRLSRGRADAVKQWLVDHGIVANRLQTRGYGATRPAASNDTDTGRAQNRRIEFKRLDAAD